MAWGFSNLSLLFEFGGLGRQLETDGVSRVERCSIQTNTAQHPPILHSRAKASMVRGFGHS